MKLYIPHDVSTKIIDKNTVNSKNEMNKKTNELGLRPQEF